jgi:CubicO group peptidase (beta-lactamase class C family)
MDIDQPLSTLAGRLAKAPLFYQPGERWLYGVSVDVQALLVERISGQPFDKFVRENVLDPLGMNETRYVVPEADCGRMMAEYVREDDGTLRQVPEDPDHFNLKPHVFTPGGFGFTSTVDDYLRFARMLLNEGELEGIRILQPATVKLMSTSHLSDAVTDRSWLPYKGEVGFGIDFAVRLRPPVSADENPGVVGEFFWDGAASTLFWVDPENDLTAVLFVQLFPFDQVGLQHGFRRAIYGPYRAE